MLIVGRGLRGLTAGLKLRYWEAIQSKSRRALSNSMHKTALMARSVGSGRPAAMSALQGVTQKLSKNPLNNLNTRNFNLNLDSARSERYQHVSHPLRQSCKPSYGIAKDLMVIEKTSTLAAKLQKMKLKIPTEKKVYRESLWSETKRLYEGRPTELLKANKLLTRQHIKLKHNHTSFFDEPEEQPGCDVDDDDQVGYDADQVLRDEVKAREQRRRKPKKEKVQTPPPQKMSNSEAIKNVLESRLSYGPVEVKKPKSMQRIKHELLGVYANKNKGKLLKKEERQTAETMKAEKAKETKKIKRKVNRTTNSALQRALQGERNPVHFPVIQKVSLTKPKHMPAAHYFAVELMPIDKMKTLTYKSQANPLDQNDVKMAEQTKDEQPKRDEQPKKVEQPKKDEAANKEEQPKKSGNEGRLKIKLTRASTNYKLMMAKMEARMEKDRIKESENNKRSESNTNTKPAKTTYCKQPIPKPDPIVARMEKAIWPQAVPSASATAARTWQQHETDIFADAMRPTEPTKKPQYLKLKAKKKDSEKRAECAGNQQKCTNDDTSYQRSTFEQMLFEEEQQQLNKSKNKLSRKNYIPADDIPVVPQQTKMQHTTKTWNSTKPTEINLMDTRSTAYNDKLIWLMKQQRNINITNPQHKQGWKSKWSNKTTVSKKHDGRHKTYHNIPRCQNHESRNKAHKPIRTTSSNNSSKQIMSSNSVSTFIKKRSEESHIEELNRSPQPFKTFKVDLMNIEPRKTVSAQSLSRAAKLTQTSTTQCNQSYDGKEPTNNNNAGNRYGTAKHEQLLQMPANVRYSATNFSQPQKFQVNLMPLNESIRTNIKDWDSAYRNDSDKNRRKPAHNGDSMYGSYAEDEREQEAYSRSAKQTTTQPLGSYLQSAQNNNEAVRSQPANRTVLQEGCDSDSDCDRVAHSKHTKQVNAYDMDAVHVRDANREPSYHSATNNQNFIWDNGYTEAAQKQTAWHERPTSQMSSKYPNTLPDYSNNETDYRTEVSKKYTNHIDTDNTNGVHVPETYSQSPHYVTPSYDNFKTDSSYRASINEQSSTRNWSQDANRNYENLLSPKFDEEIEYKRGTHWKPTNYGTSTYPNEKHRESYEQPYNLDGMKNSSTLSHSMGNGHKVDFKRKLANYTETETDYESQVQRGAYAEYMKPKQSYAFDDDETAHGEGAYRKSEKQSYTYNNDQAANQSSTNIYANGPKQHYLDDTKRHLPQYHMDVSNLMPIGKKTQEPKVDGLNDIDNKNWKQDEDSRVVQMAQKRMNIRATIGLAFDGQEPRTRNCLC